MRTKINITHEDAEGLRLAELASGASIVSSGTVSRTARRANLDRWLLSNRGRLEREDATAIALELRRLGLYSPNTTLTDIRAGFHKRCCALGILFKGKMVR